ncbi:hypothetical protein [Clostridium sp. AF32-12BH]|uniref:hypothetical protein n=1 Tax=Clostridium sp. AF32-12BH TaxID=2292006 RepID=UPI000E5032B5|nr:hypothetical protein [Clostridium sp. AF32-12BH]RHP46414.1 hypothetical protein DWZ40_10270 [Clostridium sp. AF32-12BH]
MKILKEKEKEYRKLCNKYNEHDDPWSYALLSYAERWAEMMESGLENADDPMKYLRENAGRLSKEADQEDIDMSIPVRIYVIEGILSKYWEYGKLLWKWYYEQFTRDDKGKVIIRYLEQYKEE